MFTARDAYIELWCSTSEDHYQLRRHEANRVGRMYKVMAIREETMELAEEVKRRKLEAAVAAATSTQGAVGEP